MDAYRCADAVGDPRRDGDDGRHRHRGRRSPARAGAPGRLRRGDQLPAVPRPTSLRRSCAAPAPSGSSSAPTIPLAVANPLTREVRAALYDAAAEGVMVPRVLSFSAGLGSRDVAAGDLVAVFDRLAIHGDLPDRHAVLGIRHPLALERVGRRPAAAGVVVAARSLDRRLRVGDDQQARGDARRRAVRQGRPGLPALRLGEEGPADDLLPDHRRRADPSPRGARPGRLRAAPRRLSLRARRSARGARRRRDDLHPVAVAPTPEAIWHSIPAPRPGRDRRPTDPGHGSRHRWPSPPPTPRRPTFSSGCRASPWSASSSASRRSPPAPGSTATR